MNTTINKIVKSPCDYALLVLFTLFSSTMSAQTLDDIEPISRSAYAEKIYLQLSSTVFTTDETIWFKAIVTDGVSHIPTALSKVLHVELIDANKQVIDHKLLKLEAGITDSFFQLDNTMPSGRYLIRAYTVWNTNFGKEFISDQYIDVFNNKAIKNSREPITEITLTETTEGGLSLSGTAHPELLDPKYRSKLQVYIKTEKDSDTIEVTKDKQGLYGFSYQLPEGAIKAKLKMSLNPSKVSNDSINTISIHSKTIVVDKDYLDLQFFPEGGKLIDGLLSTVGFKTLNYEGKGVFVSGDIEDQYGNYIMPFRSNSLGMGIFHLLSDSSKSYYGVITDKLGVVYKYPLPQVFSSGHVLSVKQSDEQLYVEIRNSNGKTGDVNLRLNSRGISLCNQYLQLEEGVIKVQIDKRTLPLGIIQIQIFDGGQFPICERLFFNTRADKTLDIRALSNLSSYSQRDKALIDIEVKNEEGVPQAVNLSALVINKEQLGKVHNKQPTILSYFLLDSELRGVIEAPSIYFDKTNINRYMDLDALLLTQGWSNYKYEATSGLNSFKVKPETGITISGTIGEFYNPLKRPKKSFELTLVTFDKESPKQVFEQTLDSLGRFKFDLGDWHTSELDVLVQTKERDKNRDYTVNIEKVPSPEIDFNVSEELYLPDIELIGSYLEKREERVRKVEAFKLSDNTIVLDQINLTGYKLTPAREKVMERFGPPDVVIEDKELHQKIEKWSYGLFSVLMFNYPDEITVNRVSDNDTVILNGNIDFGNLSALANMSGKANISFLKAEVNGASSTAILVDGIRVREKDPFKTNGRRLTSDEYRSLQSISTTEIKSVEIIRNPKNLGKDAQDILDDINLKSDGSGAAIIAIYTYSGKGLNALRKVHGMHKSTVKGFSPKREFYAPKHDDITYEDWKEPDLRSVVHWEPNIQTDKNGKAQIEFYNDDNIGDMLVILEGITNKGKIGYYDFTYEVEEKLEK